MLTLTRARTLIAFISLMKQFRKELCMRPTHAGARCCACGRQGRQGVPALHARAHHGAPPLFFAGVNAAEECRGCMEKSQFIEVLCRHIQA